MDGKELEYIERLVSCGFVLDYAHRVVAHCSATLGPDGLERYVRFVENLMNDHREYPKEV